MRYVGVRILQKEDLGWQLLWFVFLGSNETNQINEKNEKNPSEPSVRTAIRTGPGYAVASQSPGVFIEASAADLETAGADPTKFLPFPAAMALKGPAGPFQFPGIRR